jgi:uroporphyrinogen-III decarboxylase
MGSVDSISVQEGTPEEVRALCQTCIEEGKDHPGGYALMTGCEVPPHAPAVNVSQMVVACREFGRY